ncbi:MAG: IS66 family insertion sequence element accessory protein TnpA [Novipirellula sp. JB048]
MSRSPDPQLARDWQERLDRFEHSGLTTAEFCQTEGYSTASFYRWRRKLQRPAPLGGPTFIPLDLAPAVAEHHTGSRTEITLPGGAVVKLPGDAGLAQQRDLITAILHATNSGEVTS